MTMCTTEIPGARELAQLAQLVSARGLSIADIPTGWQLRGFVSLFWCSRTQVAPLDAIDKLCCKA